MNHPKLAALEKQFPNCWRDPPSFAEPLIREAVASLTEPADRELITLHLADQVICIHTLQLETWITDDEGAYFSLHPAALVGLTGLNYKLNQSPGDLVSVGDGGYFAPADPPSWQGIALAREVKLHAPILVPPDYRIIFALKTHAAGAGEPLPPDHTRSILLRLIGFSLPSL